MLERAAEARGEPVPDLPATLSRDDVRTGTRTRYREVWRTRQHRLGPSVLAECFEREGEYLDPILDYTRAITGRATRVWPAHLRGKSRGPARDVPDDERTVALFSVGMAKVLAEVDHVLGELLHPALRERIRAEADEQVFRPYGVREDFPWMERPANNWNAVCNAGAAVAAMHLVDDVDRQARLLTKAVHGLEAYLADFDGDGCTVEGIGYWNDGFGNYVELADHLDPGRARGRRRRARPRDGHARPGGEPGGRATPPVDDRTVWRARFAREVTGETGGLGLDYGRAGE